ARMLFRVVVLPKEEFDRFVEQAKASPAPVADERGQQVFQQNCAACHGVDGNPSVAQYPRIAGMPERYIAQQLALFKSGER
ncbi:c-type cytochrome, partial [Acinetobacter baumannii]